MDPNIRNIGRSITQINLRLGQLLKLSEGNGRAQGCDSDVLYELLDVIHAQLHHQVPGHPISWYQRLLGVRPVSTDLTGLRLGYQAAIEALATQGVTPTATEGIFNPHLHLAIDTQPSTGKGEPGQIVAVHQRGWTRTVGGELQVLRLAHVTVLKESK